MKPELSYGDAVYCRHPTKGTHIVKVLAVGKDGFQGDGEEGARYKVPHQDYLGHQARPRHQYRVADEGEDGVMLEREDGQREFVAGRRAKTTEDRQHHTKQKGAILGGLSGDDKKRSGALLREFDAVMSKALTPLPPSAFETFAKANPAKKAKAKTKNALYRHGEKVRFRHEDVEGCGTIVGSGKDGVTVEDENGREHMIRHDALVPPEAEEPEEKPAKMRKAFLFCTEGDWL